MRKGLVLIITLTFVFILSAGRACCENQKGIVGLSSIYMYSQPDYESSLETMELMGAEVEILETQRYWKKIHCAQPYTAWCTDMGIVYMSEEEIATYREAPKYIVTAIFSEIKDDITGNSKRLSDLVAGDLLRIVFDHSGKAIEKNGLCLALMPDGRKGWVRTADVEDYASWQRRCSEMKAGEKADEAVKFARKLLGCPYLWGGMTSKGVDCSGLVRLSFLMQGIHLPRNSGKQFLSGEELPLQRLSDGSFDLTALQRGDLLFFGKIKEGEKKITHVAIYLGGGRIIHASQLVRENSIIITEKDCYSNAGNLLCACRVTGPLAALADK